MKVSTQWTWDQISRTEQYWVQNVQEENSWGNMLEVFTFSQYWSSALRLCIELGRGHWDACVGTWELGTRDEGLGDIKYGTRGCVGQGQGTLNTGTWGMWMIIAKVGGICNISHFPYEYGSNIPARRLRHWFHFLQRRGSSPRHGGFPW